MCILLLLLLNRATIRMVNEYRCISDGYTYGFDGDLCLEEVDVLGEVERVLATVADHVRVQNVIGASEDARQMSLVRGAVQRALQESHQQVDDLRHRQQTHRRRHQRSY